MLKVPLKVCTALVKKCGVAVRGHSQAYEGQRLVSKGEQNQTHNFITYLLAKMVSTTLKGHVLALTESCPENTTQND